ncbi:alpha/beta hydrolase [Streptomyces sp. CA-210063]|uniref:alpha/beta hydrolase n=1 Tax=Streptomyces sp. CA-210063 TaxID=2801029 RepID=UPI00214BFEAE|nr:alpha/beta hydrolase [Streptomyces sp. CA-210063]UUU29699.1 alpha/beta hydrolase [Streptomyces sp. CA-210063]
MTSYELREHKVKHLSTVPATEDVEIELAVREYDGTPTGQDREPVLMLHGRSVPALPGFDLAPVPGGDPNRYSWAQELAQAHYDVFIMDLQGSGRSTRPGPMDDPCNANPAQQQPVLVDHTIPAPCPPQYTSELGNAESDGAELAAVVKFIKSQVGTGKRIRFVGWSAAAFVMGPYTLQHPDDVESLFLIAPMFPPRGRWSGKTEDPFGRPPGVTTLPVGQPPNQFGFPMNVGSKGGFTRPLTGPLWEAGIGERVWAACMEVDPVGSKWGPQTNGDYEGVLRYRNTYWWGWNSKTVPHMSEGRHVLGDRVPVLILYGELDRTANTQTSMPDDLYFSVPDLYAAIGGSEKLMFCFEASSHSLVWETTAQAIHHYSKHWFKNGKVEGVSSGKYFRELDGNLIPVQ